MTKAVRRRNARGEGDRLRDELIRAASTLLETLPGEEALSLRAVAREAGIAAPSIYLHFPDKGSLVSAVLASRFQELQAALDAAAVDAAAVERASPEAELAARCAAYCAYAEDHAGNYRVMFSAVPADDRPDDAGPGAEMVRRLGRLAVQCGATGDPLEAGTLLWCGLHGIVALRESKPLFPWPERDVLVARLIASITEVHKT